MTEKILKVENLSIGFSKNTAAVKNVSFSVNAGEILGIVGESGSGKSISSLAVMGLNAKSAKVLSGSIEFDGRTLLKSECNKYIQDTKKTKVLQLSEKEMQRIRGNDISMIFQEPMTSLNPVLTIGKQLEETLIIHSALSKEERKNKIYEMLAEVELQNPEELCSKYPYQLSGGMRQRVMIAMAMLLKPKLLIADEPTTALDVSLQDKILKLLKKFNEQYNTAVILISHDLGVIKSICDNVVVMQKGEVVEQDSAEKIFSAPKKEYTKRLLTAARGSMPKYELNPYSYNEKNKVMLRLENFNVYYNEKKEGSIFKSGAKKRVVNGADIKLYEGEILGIVGESGSGKSTLLKAICGLNGIYDGKIEFYEENFVPQMVFQDPYSSLNPSKRIGWLLEESLRFKKKSGCGKDRADGSSDEAAGEVNETGGSKNNSSNNRKLKYSREVYDMLCLAGLADKDSVYEFAKRFPNELSGGQRQRVAIAAALMQNRKIILLDEPVSALDVTIQEQILDMLLKLRDDFGLSYIFVSHDMNVIRRICDRVCVIYKGDIVEQNTTKELFDNPSHEYTKRLMKLSLRAE